MNIELTKNKILPVGNGFNYYNRSMECVINDVKELKELIKYQDESIIIANLSRTISDIELSVDSLLELKKAIINIRKQSIN